MSGPRRDPTAELPLHPLEFRILLALLERKRHGYDIVKEIEGRAPEAATIYPANLYRRLRDLRKRGLLEDADPPADDETGGRPRRYFRLNPFGREVARAEAGRLRALLDDERARGLLEPA